MQTAPFSVLAGASSIILDGRGFCETHCISKPYSGACRSDAAWIEGTWFDVLEPEIAAFRPHNGSNPDKEKIRLPDVIFTENGETDERTWNAECEALVFQGS